MDNPVQNGQKMYKILACVMHLVCFHEPLYYAYLEQRDMAIVNNISNEVDEWVPICKQCIKYLIKQDQ